MTGISEFTFLDARLRLDTEARKRCDGARS
jgi:hypothetical protein